MKEPEDDPITSQGERLSDLRRRARIEWEPAEVIEAEEVQESAGQPPAQGEGQ